MCGIGYCLRCKGRWRKACIDEPVHLQRQRARDRIRIGNQLVLHHLAKRGVYVRPWRIPKALVDADRRAGFGVDVAPAVGRVAQAGAGAGFAFAFGDAGDTTLAAPAVGGEVGVPKGVVVRQGQAMPGQV